MVGAWGWELPISDGEIVADKARFVTAKDWRTPTKQRLTASTSSRWAGALTRAAEDQYQLGMRALHADVASLTAAVNTIETRLAAPIGGHSQPEGGGRKVAGYRSASEAHQKRRRLDQLRHRLAKAQSRLAAGRPAVVVSGRSLLRTGSTPGTSRLRG